MPYTYTIRRATYIIRGVKRKDKRILVEQQAKNKQLDIGGVQETYIQDNTKWIGGEYTWYFSIGVSEADKKHRANATHKQRREKRKEHVGLDKHGVAIMIRNKILRAV